MQQIKLNKDMENLLVRERGFVNSLQYMLDSFSEGFNIEITRLNTLISEKDAEISKLREQIASLEKK